MLDYLRKNSRSFLIVFFIIALSIVFIINFGSQAVGWRAGGYKELVLGRVYDHKITESEFIYEMRLIRSRIPFRDEFLESDSFKKTLLNALVERELLVKVAEDLGLAIDEELLFDEIVNNLNIYFSWPSEELSIIHLPAKLYDFVDEDGKFLHEDFEAYVRYLGLGLKGFVEEQKRDMLAHKVREIVMNNVEVSPLELKENYWRRNTKVNLSFVRIWPQFFEDRIEPSQKELTLWAKEHKKEIENYYKANRFKYSNVPEEIRLKHIFIKVPEDSDEEKKLELRGKAERLLELVELGVDFSLLARCYSDDERSKYKGGDLGYIRKGLGDWGDNFYEAVFNLKPGVIEGPIESEKGYHIVKVIDKRKGDISLEEAKLEIAETLYKKEKGKEIANRIAKELLSKLKNGKELNEELLNSFKELQLRSCPKLSEEEEEIKEDGGRFYPKVEETGMFNKVSVVIPRIGDSPKLREIAFKLTLDSPLPKDIVEFRNSFIVFKLKEREEPKEEQFEKEKEMLYKALLEQKRYAMLLSFVKELREKAEKEGEIEIKEELLLGKKKEEKRTPTEKKKAPPVLP